ncbi:hypothetical protein DTO207G8_9125 [Paecilomyces variotii]|nr:hypothetical protein DTO207G8_9125 [Paecilomyces variotii]
MATLTSRCAVVSPTPRSPIKILPFEVGRPPADSIHVEIIQAGICGTDPHLWKGDYELRAPIVLGHEGIGKVISMNPTVITDHAGQPLHEGDIVYWTAIRPCRKCYYCTVLDDECGCPSNGFMHNYEALARAKEGTWATYSQYATLGPRNSFYRVSPDVPPEAYIALGCALPAVIQATSRLRKGHIEPHSTVLVQGCGAVGLAAIMMAKLSGALKVVVIDRNPIRLAKAKEFGADDCINLDEVTDMGERAKRITTQVVGDRGVDLAIECSGHPSAIREGLGLLARNGTYLLIGTWAGKAEVLFDPFVVVNKALHIQGSTYGAPRDYYRASKVVEQNWQRFPLASCVTHKFSLDETQLGLETVMSGLAVKAVVEPNRKGN